MSERASTASETDARAGGGTPETERESVWVSHWQCGHCGFTAFVKSSADADEQHAKARPNCFATLSRELEIERAEVARLRDALGASHAELTKVEAERFRLRDALAAAQADVKRLETDYRQLDLDSKALVETIEHMGDRIRTRELAETQVKAANLVARYRMEAEERTRERDAAREDGAMLNNAEAGQWGISPQVGGGWVIEISSGEDVVEIARTRGTLRAALSLAAARPTPERAEPRHPQITQRPTVAHRAEPTPIPETNDA